jgi:hypothetical protein
MGEVMASETYVEWLAKVQADGSMLRYVPEEFKTLQMCLEAVRRDGYGSAFMYVPDNHKTPELCLMAVRQSGFALKRVPEKYKTAELCLEAIRQGCGRALEFVSEQFKTPELCLLAVRLDGTALEFVPEALQTEELCLEAMGENIDALQWVYNMTPTVCREVEDRWDAWDFLPRGYWRAYFERAFDVGDLEEDLENYYEAATQNSIEAAGLKEAGYGA